MDEEQNYDVVIDTLQKNIDKLWKITNTNEEWGIMDFIRMEQIDEMKQCIALWKKHKESKQ